MMTHFEHRINQLERRMLGALDVAIKALDVGDYVTWWDGVSHYKATRLELNAVFDEWKHWAVDEAHKKIQDRHNAKMG